MEWCGKLNQREQQGSALLCGLSVHALSITLIFLNENTMLLLGKQKATPSASAAFPAGTAPVWQRISVGTHTGGTDVDA